MHQTLRNSNTKWIYTHKSHMVVGWWLIWSHSNRSETVNKSTFHTGKALHLKRRTVHGQLLRGNGKGASRSTYLGRCCAKCWAECWGRWHARGCAAIKSEDLPANRDELARIKIEPCWTHINGAFRSPVCIGYISYIRIEPVPKGNPVGNRKPRTPPDRCPVLSMVHNGPSIWGESKMVVSINGGTSKSSILMAFSTRKTIHLRYLHDYGNLQMSIDPKIMDSGWPGDTSKFLDLHVADLAGTFAIQRRVNGAAALKLRTPEIRYLRPLSFLMVFRVFWSTLTRVSGMGKVANNNRAPWRRQAF